MPCHRDASGRRVQTATVTTDSTRPEQAVRALSHAQQHRRRASHLYGLVITGSVLARNATLSDGGNIINGTQDVSYSKCAIESALRGSAVLVKVPQRAWAQLF